MEVSVKGYERIADIKRLNFIIKSLELSVPSDGYILDVGCGNGVISQNLGKLGYRVKGIDVSDNAIQKAIEDNPFPNVTFEVISAEKNTYPENTYDAIICSEVLEHLEQPDLLLKELYGALKNDGILIVTVPNGLGPREVLVTKPTQYLYRKKGIIFKIMQTTKRILGYSGTTVQSAADNLDHIQFFSKKDVRKLSAKNGFRITRFLNSNFVDDVFPFSLLTKRLRFLQQFDCWVADFLPNTMTGGFFMIWEKTEGNNKITY